jgi:hypothetical protein
MSNNIANGFKLWAWNLPLLSALVWTIRLPGNVILTYVSATAGETISPTTEIQLLIFFEGIFGPIYAGAVIYALQQRLLRQRVTYFEALGVGFRCWGRLFFTRFMASLIVALGLLTFLVPGIIFAVRYTLLDPVVVLEGREGSDARKRSWLLTKGRGLPVFGICLLFYVLLVAVTAILHFPFEMLYEMTEMTDLQYYAGTTVIDCILDVIGLPIVAILFCVYVEAGGSKDESEEPSEAETDFAPPLARDARHSDDGNPYRPPAAI